MDIPSSSPNNENLSFSSAVLPPLPVPRNSSSSDNPPTSPWACLWAFFSRLNCPWPNKYRENPSKLQYADKHTQIHMHKSISNSTETGMDLGIVHNLSARGYHIIVFQELIVIFIKNIFLSEKKNKKQKQNKKRQKGNIRNSITLTSKS